jgi:hypothetical protein
LFPYAYELEYSSLLVTNMDTNEYRIEPSGAAFIVIDPWGEKLVDVFPTEDAAKQNIERCKREDETYETAQQLVDISVKTLMQMHSVDRETANYWINCAMGGS